MYERTIISDGASKTWAMTGWRIGFTANPALAPVFTRWITNTESCASQISQWAAVEAINGPQDAADAMRESLPRAPRPDRRPAQRGAGRDVPDAGRRVLRVAQRHRGLPHDRRGRFARSSASACCTRPASRCSPTSTSARACPGDGQHVRFSLRRLQRGDRAGRRAHGRLHPTNNTPPKPRMGGLEAERDGRRRHRARGPLLLVEEEARRPARLNQPAGHWDPGESLADACAREVLEETAHSFRPTHLLGDLPLALRPGDVTFLRFAFLGECPRRRTGRSTGRSAAWSGSRPRRRARRANATAARS